MKLKRGSIGWTSVTLTAAYLTQQANLLESASARRKEEPLSDEEFKLIAAHALDHWGVDPFGRTPARASIQNILLDWRNGKNLPDEELRYDTIEWIVDDIRVRAANLQGLVS